MTADARAVIDEFRSLPNATQREVLAEILRIADFPPLEDGALVGAANEVFLSYDEREDAD